MKSEKGRQLVLDQNEKKMAKDVVGLNMTVRCLLSGDVKDQRNMQFWPCRVNEIVVQKHKVYKETMLTIGALAYTTGPDFGWDA